MADDGQGAGQLALDPPRQRGDPRTGMRGWLDAHGGLEALCVVRLGIGPGIARRSSGMVDWLRASSSFFHFNRQAGKPNKIVPFRNAGQNPTCAPTAVHHHARQRWNEVALDAPGCHAGHPHSRPAIRVMRHKGKIGQDIDHPAVFLVALPEFVIEAYTDAGDIVFEPFGGRARRCWRPNAPGASAAPRRSPPKYVTSPSNASSRISGVPVTLTENGGRVSPSSRSPPSEPPWEVVA